MRRSTQFRLVSIALGSVLAAGCSVGPEHQRPLAPEPAVFKQAGPWVPALPADAQQRGPWWRVFNDRKLDELLEQVQISNQNVAAAQAAYAQASALVRQQRAGLLPGLSLGASGEHAGNDDTAGNRFGVRLASSWEPDLWGRLRSGIDASGAAMGASAADLAGAQLSAQAELAQTYVLLRQSDAQLALLGSTVEGFGRSLEVARNRFEAGIAARSDVLQAQTQLANANIAVLDLTRQRARFEHAIAILIGKAPAGFALAVSDWQASVPLIPSQLPSTLLQRRPDIAAAERRVAAANAQIGVARSAWYPSISLSGALGGGASRVGELFNASNALWSFGLSAAQTLFDAGAIKAQVSGAEARHKVAVAQYRQSVLDAFGEVENALAGTRLLEQQQLLRVQASNAADQVETQFLNRYKAGQVGYTEVVQAQATALAARRALVQVQAERQGNAIALIQSLGGGWHAQ